MARKGELRTHTHTRAFSLRLSQNPQLTFFPPHTRLPPLASLSSPAILSLSLSLFGNAPSWSLRPPERQKVSRGEKKERRENSPCWRENAKDWHGIRAMSTNKRSKSLRERPAKALLLREPSRKNKRRANCAGMSSLGAKSLRTGSGKKTWQCARLYFGNTPVRICAAERRLCG